MESITILDAREQASRGHSADCEKWCRHHWIVAEAEHNQVAIYVEMAIGKREYDEMETGLNIAGARAELDKAEWHRGDGFEIEADLEMRSIYIGSSWNWIVEMPDEDYPGQIWEEKMSDQLREIGAFIEWNDGDLFIYETREFEPVEIEPTGCTWQWRDGGIIMEADGTDLFFQPDDAIQFLLSIGASTNDLCGNVPEWAILEYGGME